MGPNFTYKIHIEEFAIGSNASVQECTASLQLSRGINKVLHTMPGAVVDVRTSLAEMLCGGVIMDVINEEQARIAEKAGAVAVMGLEKVPFDIRAEGGIARMADPIVIKKIKSAVSIPVMAKVRIGHMVEAQILQELSVDFIDESEVLTPADSFNHIEKTNFTIPFVCGCRNLGEALHRINEGASMIRSKGNAGTGDVSEAVNQIRHLKRDIELLQQMSPSEKVRFAETLKVPPDLVEKTATLGRLPVVTFAAGGIATPADAALMMQLGMDGVFVGSGIFKSSDPEKRAQAIVQSVTHYMDPKAICEASMNLGKAML